jgi:hypothetical protein
MRRVVLFVMLWLGLAATAEAVPTWRLLSSGSDHGSWAYSQAAIETEGQGRIFHTWGAQGGTWLYNATTNTWAQQTTAHGPDRYENAGATYDPTNNLFWLGNGNPQGTADGVPIMGAAGGAIFTYDPATSNFFQVSPLEPPYSGCAADSVWVWYNDAIFCWGGYSQPGGALRRKITSPLSYSAAWTYLPATNTPPQWTVSNNGSQYHWRGGVHASGSYLWFMAESNELYKCPIVAQSCASWVHVTTTGVKPTALYVGYALDESRNKIVGWVSCDTDGGGDCPAYYRQTYMLNLTTNVWSLGPGPSDPHPSDSVMQLMIPLYDPMRSRVLWLVRNGVSTEVWWYDDDGTGSPPGTPPAAPTGRGRRRQGD